MCFVSARMMSEKMYSAKRFHVAFKSSLLPGNGKKRLKIHAPFLPHCCRIVLESPKRGLFSMTKPVKLGFVFLSGGEGTG